MISDIKNLREETNGLISDLKTDISTLEKKIYSLKSLNILIDNIFQYEQGGELVISEDIILRGTQTKNCKDIVLVLF